MSGEVNKEPKRISGYAHEEACKYIMDLEIQLRKMDEKIEELRADNKELRSAMWHGRP